LPDRSQPLNKQNVIDLSQLKVYFIFFTYNIAFYSFLLCKM
jgi:hypothetical protein